LIVFLLHRESLKLILVDKPLILCWFFVIGYQSKLGATH
jgi:hypothetical protein